jgi:hypothetical protein
MQKLRSSIFWFNRTYKTTEDIQFIVLVFFILFIAFTKCYVSLYPQAKTKQGISLTVPEKR